MISEKQLLTSSEYECLLQHRFDGPLLGYRSGLSPPTLYTLHELLHEHWLGERLIDAICDILAGELNRTTPNLIKILDSNFHLELLNSYHVKCFSPKLTKYQHEFLANPPLIIAFVLNKDQCHWAPTTTIINIRTVLQGNSSSFPLNKDLQAMVQWWLQDVVLEDGEWEERILAIEQQSIKSGSCALASITAISSLALIMEETLTGKHSDISFAPWKDKESSSVRCNWLQVLLRAHLAALDTMPVHIYFRL
jgi:hypothetical protein